MEPSKPEPLDYEPQLRTVRRSAASRESATATRVAIVTSSITLVLFALVVILTANSWMGLAGMFLLAPFAISMLVSSFYLVAALTDETRPGQRVVLYLFLAAKVGIILLIMIGVAGVTFYALR